LTHQANKRIKILSAIFVAGRRKEEGYSVRLKKPASRNKAEGDAQEETAVPPETPNT
jgi:hypothetical protein